MTAIQTELSIYESLIKERSINLIYHCNETSKEEIITIKPDQAEVSQGTADF